MKKVFSILLALMLLVSLGTAAMADDSTFTSEEMGITLQYPGEFGNLQGLLFLSPHQAPDLQASLQAIQHLATQQITFL